VDQKKYDRVSRVTGVREDLSFTLDINSEIYPLSVDDTVQLSIASTLSLDGTIATKESEAAKGGWREMRAGEATLADQYDYVCYGKMYRFEESAGDMM
jgi:DNA-directed RNA polymerase I, II, and III subunit RPABC3